MKSRFLTCFTAMMFGVRANPGRLAAQDNRGHHHKHHHYKLLDMGTFGGPDSCCSGTLTHGVTVGEAATSTPITATSNPLVCGGEQSAVPLMFHAFQWKNGTLTDLEALSEDGNCSNASVVNNRREIFGVSENGEVDPQTGFNLKTAGVIDLPLNLRMNR